MWLMEKIKNRLLRYAQETFHRPPNRDEAIEASLRFPTLGLQSKPYIGCNITLLTGVVGAEVYR